MMYKIKIGKYTSKNSDKKKRKDTWYYKFQKPGLTETGSRKYEYQGGFATKAEAGDAASKKYLEIYGIETSDRPFDTSIANMTFSSYVTNHWWKVSEPMWKQGTVRNYKKYLKNHLIPKFGNMALCDITQEMLQEYFNKLYISSNLSVNTSDNMRNLMSQIFNYATSNRHILYNPMASVQKPNLRIASAVSKHKQVRDVISDEILEKIIARFPQGTPAYIPFTLCLNAGLRIGEVFGLAWCDVDFENHCIYVTRQLQRRERTASPTYYEQKQIQKYPSLDNEIWCTCNPKYESKRVIPMSSELEIVLSAEKKRQEYFRHILGSKYKKYYYTREFAPKYFNDLNSFITAKKEIEYENGIVNLDGIGYEIDFVNRYEDGAIVTESTLKHLSRIVQGKEKEPAICEFYNNHSLRHTFASRLRASGTDEHIVQALLGHKSTKETKTYLHLTTGEYASISLSMNSDISKVDFLVKTIRSNNLSEQQIDMLISKLKSEAS